MKYRYVSDGYEFEANSPKEICTAIWKSMLFSFHATLEEWVHADAEMQKKLSGRILNTSSPDTYGLDLVRHGIIEPIGR